MSRLALSVFLVAFITSSRVAAARYTEELHEGNDGAWMFAYVILLFIGGKHIHGEMKKGSSSGAKALAIVGALAVAAYMFPIINGILVAGVAVAFAYGMLTTGGR